MAQLTVGNLSIGRGYDHNWALDKGITAQPELAARLVEPTALQGAGDDVVVVGAGLVGASFTLALGGADLSVALVEREGHAG